MPQKPKDVVAPPLRPSLVVSREDAAEKFMDRIERGRELLERDIGSWEQLEAVRKDYSKWSDYNDELLRRLFSSGMFADEYSAFYGAVINTSPTLCEETSDLRRDIQDKIHRLESIHERLELIPLGSSVPSRSESRSVESASGTRVFVVHGHDEAARESTARFLEQLGVQAIILHEKPNEGRTIIEKLEYNSSVDFAVVLLTPDDVGAVATSADSMNPRARQNVVLELGYFIGKLGRDRVCALHRGSVELPSDILGVVYNPLDNGGGWKLLLAKELRAAGFSIDLNKAM